MPYLFIKLANISVLFKKGIESVMFFWGGLLNDFKTKRDSSNLTLLTLVKPLRFNTRLKTFFEPLSTDDCSR